MKLDNLNHINQLQDFLTGSQPIAFEVAISKDERYRLINKLLSRFGYAKLSRQAKGIMIAFLQKITGYSRQQLTRLIKQHRQTGQITSQQQTANGFRAFYTAEDHLLIAQMDQRHDTPSGMMIKKLCERAYHVFDDMAYERLAKISVSHIYNLRQSPAYQRHRQHYEKTKRSHAQHIGERRAPRPNGQPGYLRIDTVHQGDQDGRKGIYHINATDQVTQFEIVVSVEKISEAYLLPALKLLLHSFPFTIQGFHSDNGSEYVNQTVARLLEKLRIEFTKSRPRTSTDNALAEGKNAAIVRKFFGYSHIPQRYAQQVNCFNHQALNPYINYHRPCLYPTTFIDDKGKEKKRYRYQQMMTPYEKFKSLPDATRYLKEGLSFEKLDDIATKMTDNQAADYLQQQRKLLFNYIHEQCQKHA